MLEREPHGSITVLRMAHGKASALDTDFLNALTEHFEAELSGPAKAVVLTGTGGIFSAGVDLRKVLQGRAYLETFLPALDRMLHALAAFDKPLVAAINGHAIAGGCVLACAADQRYCVNRNAKIGAPELTVGVPFPPTALEIVRLAVPAQHLRTVLLAGSVVSPEGALRLGLVDQLIPPSDLLEHALAGAASLARSPSAAYRLTKRQIWEPARSLMRRPLKDEMLEVWSSPAVQKAIATYVANVLGG